MIELETGAEESTMYLLEPTDDGAHVGTCERGHQIRLALQNLRYELLYESGIVALLLGFNRESVTSIATALERFYEFAIQVLCAHSEVSTGAYETAWKEVSSRSERQLGAFQFLHVVVLKEAFTPPEPKRHKKMIELRNDVVHKGRIPSRDEATTFARDAYDIVDAVRGRLAASCKDAVERVRHRRMVDVHSAMQGKAPDKQGPDGTGWGVPTGGFPMMLGPWSLPHELEFDDALAAAEGRLDIWGYSRPADGFRVRNWKPPQGTT